MIQLNGKKFASNDNEFTNSLFESGGTCCGYYKVNKKSITIMNHKKEKIGVIANNVLGKATKIDDRWWYSYGKPEVIGEYQSYITECEEIQAITKRFNLPVKY